MIAYSLRASHRRTMAAARYARLPCYVDTDGMNLHRTLRTMHIFGLLEDNKDFLLYLETIGGYNQIHVVARYIPEEDERLPELSLDDLDLHNAQWALLTDDANGLFDVAVGHDGVSGRMFIAVSQYTFSTPRVIEDLDNNTQAPSISSLWEQTNTIAFYSRGFFCMPCTRNRDHCLLVVQGDLAENRGSCRQPVALVKLPDGVATCDHGHWERFFFPGLADDTARLCVAVKMEQMITIYIQCVTASAPGSWEICRDINIVQAMGTENARYFQYHRDLQKWTPIRFRWLDFYSGFLEVEDWEGTRLDILLTGSSRITVSSPASSVGDNYNYDPCFAT